MNPNEILARQIADLREKHKLPTGFVIMHLSQIETVEKALQAQRKTILEAGIALGPFFIAAEIAVALLIIVKHHQNIRRLIAGTESRLGKKKPA